MACMARKLRWIVLLALIVQGCVNLELTLQRTALENQILGEYEQIDDDLMLMTSVRAVDEQGHSKNIDFSDFQKKAVEARQNQQFNLDDIDELKSAEILGERLNGELALLSNELGLVSLATKDQLSLAKVLVQEENRDRMLIWQRIIQQNQDLGSQDLPKVRETFATRQFELAKSGHWVEKTQGNWTKKESQ